MEKEPLKNKLIKYHNGIHPKCNICKIEEDLKSAIEWLKREDTKALVQYKCKCISLFDLVKKLSYNKNKAFEDILKTEKQRK